MNSHSWKDGLYIETGHQILVTKVKLINVSKRGPRQQAHSWSNVDPITGSYVYYQRSLVIAWVKQPSVHCVAIEIKIGVQCQWANTTSSPNRQYKRQRGETHIVYHINFATNDSYHINFATNDLVLWYSMASYQSVHFLLTNCLDCVIIFWGFMLHFHMYGDL